MSMVPVEALKCSDCGISLTIGQVISSRCLACFERLKTPAPTATAWCSTCKVRKPLSEMLIGEDGWFCLDCNPRRVTAVECPICNVLKASSEMADDRKCCLECAVELDLGVGLTRCPECGKTTAAARDGTALCTECATQSNWWFGAKKVEPPVPGAFEEGRICLVCRFVLPLEVYDGQGKICKRCASGLPPDLVKRMQRCRGCNLEKPSAELLGTMYCTVCRALGIEMTSPATFLPELIERTAAQPDPGPAAPQIGRIPRAIATEEE